MVPAWARDPAIGQRLINARVETLAERPAFRASLPERRCVIFADGFFEWTGAKDRRQPYRFTVGGGTPFAFAALWDRWAGGDDPLETCTIVTCEANRLLAPLHDRMPAILTAEALDAWLHGSVADALGAIAPFDARRMQAYPVTPQMNHHAFEDPRAIAPIAPIPSALALFLISLISSIVSLIAAVSILVTEHYPESLWNFQRGVVRWEARLLGYLASLVETYPPYSLSA